MQTQYLDFVADNGPGPDCGIVEVENDEGKSVNIGKWFQRSDGYWVLRVWLNMHTHAAGPADDIDACAKCGHDIRHPIHSMSAIEQ